MADGRKNNRGTPGNKGGGRKPKADEEKLIQKLSEFDDIAFKAMQNGIKEGNYNFWNKFMEYRYGKPKERLDVTTGGDSFNLPVVEFFGKK